MMKRIDIAAAGYPSIDRIIRIEDQPRVGRTSIIENSDSRTDYFGGCNVNIAYIASSLGFICAPMMRVGHDFELSGYRGFLEGPNMILDGVQTVEDEITSSSTLIVTGEGEHVTLFYPGAMNGKYDRNINEELIRDTRYGLIMVGEPHYNIRFAEACLRYNVPVIFGMKCDFKAFPPEVLRKVIAASEVIFMNAFEQESLEDFFKLEHITELFHRHDKTKVIIVTKGSEGSDLYALVKGRLEHHNVPIARAERVVDTTGAGDAYIAGFIYGYLTGRPVLQCGRLGAVVSSFVVEKAGCLTNVPDIERIKERYTKYYEEDLI
ncbi:MAG: hypothetical protein APF77_03650 [Clostridia bacterium BRH_c25]|nr:MAG: hypothetical protein APF77_03650 [Clostridia bacterium BRH_c25]